MFGTEDTNQYDNEFLAGLSETDDFSEEETEEETTADTEEQAEDTTEAEQTEESDKTEQTAEQKEQSADVEMFPRVIDFQGQQRQISMDEAVKEIQKGMGYYPMRDKLKADIARMKNDPRILFVENMAKAAGVSAGEYITMQNNQSEYKALIDEYGDLGSVPPAVMDKFNKYSQAAIEKAKADDEAAKQRAYREEKAAEYMNFMENHPEFSGEMPQAVMDMVSKGESLEGAYAIHRVAELEKELAQTKKDFDIYKANSTNKNSRIPSPKSGKKKEMDAFLEGLLGGI